MKVTNKRRFTISITILVVILTVLVFITSEIQYEHMKETINNKTVVKAVREYDGGVTYITKDGSTYYYDESK